MRLGEKNYGEWDLDFGYGRDVRHETPLYAPCGCVDEEQRCCTLDVDVDGVPSFIECQGCGATWECYEGSDWKHFGEE